MGIRYSYGEITSKNYHKLRYNPLDHGFIRNVFQNQTIQDLKISDHHFPYSSIYIYTYIYIQHHIFISAFRLGLCPAPRARSAASSMALTTSRRPRCGARPGRPGLAGLGWRGWGWSARHQDVDIWVRHHL